MWNKLTLRVKITILTALVLSFVAIGITMLSVFNAGQIFLRPTLNFLEHGYIEMFLVPAEFVSENILTPNDILSMANEQQLFFLRYSTIIAAVFVLVGTIAAYIISGQVLKPIKSLTEKMENIDANNLSTLIELPKSKDEVSRLTHTFNNMIGKINRSFETQKLFAQNAAHELKTPLSFIRGSIDVLEIDDKPTTEEYQDVVNIVKDSTERLIELVEGLLSLNNSTDEIGWQTFNGKGIFENIINELANDITQKNIEVSVTGDCCIKGDKTLLGRALSNLVHNAVRYNVDNGTVKITLSDNEIIIEDSGVGIPTNNLPHIFEPFYCVDKSRSKKLGGHGLGMTIAKNIFDKHGIDVHIYSELGKGTKIVLKK